MEGGDRVKEWLSQRERGWITVDRCRPSPLLVSRCITDKHRELDLDSHGPFFLFISSCLNTKLVYLLPLKVLRVSHEKTIIAEKICVCTAHPPASVLCHSANNGYDDRPKEI